MKTWQIIASVFCLLTIAIISVVNAVVPADSQDCSICGHLKCHAPCILNLTTGEIGELELYMPHDTEVGEIAEGQPGGTFGFISVAGLHGIKLTDPWYIELEVPMEGNKKRLSHYCDSCRKRLEDYQSGFVLLDVYDINNTIIYRIEDGASYEMRCYTIRISENQENDTAILCIQSSSNNIGVISRMSAILNKVSNDASRTVPVPSI